MLHRCEKKEALLQIIKPVYLVNWRSVPLTMPDFMSDPEEHLSMSHASNVYNGNFTRAPGMNNGYCHACKRPFDYAYPDKGRHNGRGTPFATTPTRGYRQDAYNRRRQPYGRRPVPRHDNRYNSRFNYPDRERKRSNPTRHMGRRDYARRHSTVEESSPKRGSSCEKSNSVRSEQHQPSLSNADLAQYDDEDVITRSDNKDQN